MKTELENVDIIATAFKNRIITYKINPLQNREYLAPEDFLYDVTKVIIQLIQRLLKTYNSLKINFELFANFVLSKSEWQEIKSFNTKYEIVFHNTDLNEMLMKVCNVLKDKLIDFEHCESGWSFRSPAHLEINISKYSPLRGGTYIESPSVIRNTKSCLNIKNNDEYCFLWSVVAALFPSKKNVNRPSSYPYFASVLNTQGMEFPPSSNDIKLFEKRNPTISINVYGVDNKNNITGPLYKTNERKINHINLLYIEKEKRGHYCLIKDLERLVHNG